jgi:hypothetical protein
MTPRNFCMVATRAQGLGVKAWIFESAGYLYDICYYLAGQPGGQRPDTCVEQGQNRWTAVEKDYAQTVIGIAA